MQFGAKNRSRAFNYNAEETDSLFDTAAGVLGIGDRAAGSIDVPTNDTRNPRFRADVTEYAWSDSGSLSSAQAEDWT